MELNERLAKSNTTAGKLSETLGYVDELHSQIKEYRMLINLIDKTLLSDLISTKANVDLEYVQSMRNRSNNLLKKYPKP